MAHPLHKKLAGLDPAAQTKTLIAEFPGRVAVLLNRGKTKTMRFKDSTAALRWCESHQASFYYLRPDPVQN